MSDIFDDPSFKHFDIVEEYTGLCITVSPKKQHNDLTLGHYAIVPANWINALDCPLCVIKIDHFAEGKLLAFRDDKVGKNNLIYFKKGLLIIELKWMRNFLSSITHHLKNRHSHGESILKFSHIKQLIGEIVSDLEMVKMLLVDDETHLNQAHQLNLSACLKLMKLPGGRAFLKGSVLEMLWTFEGIQNVYFN